MGYFLMTGTGIVTDDFSLDKGDAAAISNQCIGTLQIGVGRV
jgi:hypothetical protein